MRRRFLQQMFPLVLAISWLVPLADTAATVTTHTLHTSAPGTPTALAKGDFNADGVPDLVATYATGSTGIAIIHRGNPAWRHGQGAPSPFLPTTQSLKLPQRPDFAAVGDFNGDRHHDLLIASLGATTFLLLPGRGNGEFDAPVVYALPGALTAFASGDFGIEDGAPDLAFATASQIHLYESMRGALRGAPHVIEAPSATIHAMALGAFDEALGGDLLMAESGQSGYWVLSGDDCRDAAEQRHVQPQWQPAGIDIAAFRQAPDVFGAPVRQAVALPETPVASVAMPLDQDGQLDAVFLTQSGAVMMALSNLAATLVTENGEVNFSADLSDGDLADGVCDTGTRTRRTGLCTLRAVIENANFSGTGTNITFLVPEVRLANSLPRLSVPILVDGRVNGVDGTKVLITGEPGREIGLIFDLGQGTAFSAIRNIVFNNYFNAVVLRGGNSIVEGCYFGVDRTGTSVSGNAFHAVITTSDSNMIGGTTPAARNLITAFHPTLTERTTLIISGQFNRVQGNYIGTDVTGMRRLGAPTLGVAVCDSPKNFIGGTDPGTGNVIVGAVDGTGPCSGTTSGMGVSIAAFNTPAEVNRIQGNRIGVAVDGQTIIANRRHGIFATGNFTIVQHNVVSGNNDSGLFIDGVGFDVLNNMIGTDSTGRLLVPNGLHGVVTRTRAGAPSRIGGLMGRNVISGNGGNGIQVNGGDPVLFIGNNYIGVASDGLARLANGGHGIQATSFAGPIIGGVSGGNVVSGNVGHGIVVTGNNTPPQITGNLIGLAADGTTPRGNGGNGIQVEGLAMIGGSTPADRNIISANLGAGINARVGGGIVLGNYIGTDITGTLDRGNGSDGVTVEATGTIAVGGLNAGDGNRIAFNRRTGIFRQSRFPSIYLSNEIFANDALGIDTTQGQSPDGPNPQTVGINQLLNSPVLQSASSTNSGTTVRGLLRNVAAIGPVLFQFFANPACDPSGFGEGRRLIGSSTMTAPATGDLQINVTLPGAVPQEMFLTATATVRVEPAPPTPEQSRYFTSEFSNCVQIPLTCGPDISSQIAVTRSGFRLDRTKNRFVQTVMLRNITDTPLSGAISLVLDNLSSNATLSTATGTTTCSIPISPYQDVLAVGDTLAPGASRSVGLEFTNPTNTAITYTTRVLGRGPR